MIKIHIHNIQIKGTGTIGEIGIYDYDDPSVFYYITNTKLWFLGIGLLAERAIVENVIIYNIGLSGILNWTGNPTFRNVLSFNCGMFCWTGGGVNIPILENCGSSDGTVITELPSGTKTNCRPNLIDTNEFEAIVDTDHHFLRPKPAYISIGATPDKVRGREPLYVKFDSFINFTAGAPNIGENGIIPIYAGLTDISGNPRPGIDNRYSMGPHEMEIRFV